MRTVRDVDGTELLLVKASSDASLVQHPETGDQFYVENDRLTPASGSSALQLAATAVSDAVRTLLSAVHDDRALGLLLELHEQGPLSVRTILTRYDLCESDVHGITGELQAASLITETTIAGERGYELTDTGTDAIERLLDAE